MKTGSGPELSPNETLLICFAGKYFGVLAPGTVWGDGRPPLHYVGLGRQTAKGRHLDYAFGLLSGSL